MAPPAGVLRRKSVIHFSLVKYASLKSGWEAGRPRLGAGALGFSETSAASLGSSVNEAACVSPGVSR